MYIESSVLVKSDKRKVFEVMADVEKWPEFLSLHRKQKILSISEKEGNIVNITLERGGKIRWRLFITINNNDCSIISKQIQGPVKGLEARWRFEELPEGTKMTITHQLNYKIFLIGKLIEIIAAKVIKKLTKNTLKAVKRRVEEGWRL